MFNYEGDQQIMRMEKTGLLSSRRIPGKPAQRTVSWAEQMGSGGKCVVLGHYSDIEKKVFRVLLAGGAKIILVLSSPIKGSLRKDVRKAIDENRLLLISPENAGITKPSYFTAETRNRLIVFLSDELFIAYTRRGGLLENIMSRVGERFIRNTFRPDERLILPSA